MFSKLKFFVFISFVFLLANTVLSQETVSIGTEELNANTVLQLVSPKGNQGFLVPKLSTSQRQNMQLQAANDNGMLVYDTDETRFYYWHNKEWYILSVSSDVIAETDPLFAVSVANSITQADTSSWNSSIASFTELDSVYSAWDKSYYDLTSSPSIIDSILAVIDTTNQLVRTEVDGSITNEIQSISRTGLTVTLSNSGTFTDSVNTQNVEDVLSINNNAGVLQIKNIANPTGVQDAATKAYVDVLGAQIETLQIATGIFTISDYDSNIYNTVKIGNQVWMKENLKVTHYPNGDEIPLVIDNTAWGALVDNNTDGAYCIDSLHNYGALYTYAAAIADNWARDNINNQGVCPDNWHLPSDAEWTELEVYLIDNAYNWDGITAGNRIAKSLASIGVWYYFNDQREGTVGSHQSSNNSSGFSALPGESRMSISGSWSFRSSSSYWWCSTETNSGTANSRSINYDVPVLRRSTNRNKSSGFSVRCVMD